MSKQRRSRSSNDLLGEQFLKKMLGRSDSVNSGYQNEEAIYKEYRNLVLKKGGVKTKETSKDRAKKVNIKDAILKDKIKKTKLKISKSSKNYKKKGNTAQMRKTGGSTFHEKRDTDREKPDIIEKIHLLSNRIQNNYEHFANYLGTNENIAVINGKKIKKKKPFLKKKDVFELDSMPYEEQKLIDDEILLPKISDSDYNLNNFDKGKKQKNSSNNIIAEKPIYGGKNGKGDGKKIPRGSGNDRGNSNEEVNDKEAEEYLNQSNSKHSYNIRDSASSYKDESQINTGHRQVSLKHEKKEDPLSKSNLEKWMNLISEFKQ